MNPEELRTLYRSVTVGDRRTTDEQDIYYWAAMAREGRWTFATAIRALVIFRTQNPGKWIDPGHITEIIRDARRRAGDTFVVPQEPDGLKNADYPAWLRSQLTAHQDRLLAKWAGGGDLPVTANGAAEITGGPKQIAAGLNLEGCPPELRDQVKRDFEQAGRDKVDRRRLPTRIRTFVGDAARRAKARAELDAKRAELGQEAS